MSEEAVLEVAPREVLGRGGARAARREGRVPAVVYGGSREPLSVTVDHRALDREFHKGGFTNRLISLTLSGETQRVLPREVQLHPVSDRILHVDFLRIEPHSQVRLSVPVVFEDEEESVGLRRGGVVNVVRHEIELVCRADSIPEHIVVSLRGLDIGDGVHRDDISWAEGVRPAIADRNFTIATVAAPTIHVEPEEEAAEGEEEEGAGVPVEGEEAAAEGAAEKPSDEG